MSRENTILPSLRNLELRTVKMEMKLTYISTNNIIQLNEVAKLNAGAKFVCEKIVMPLRSTKKNQNQDGSFDWKFR